MIYDKAQISIGSDESGNLYEDYELTCEMPRLGSIIINFYRRDGMWFLKYENYPLVKCATYSNLLLGITSKLYLTILPSATSGNIITADNINEFSIVVGMEI